MIDYVSKLKVRMYLRSFFWICILELAGYITLFSAAASKTNSMYYPAALLCVIPYFLSSIVFVLALVEKKEWGWKKYWQRATIFAFIPFINIISLYFTTIINMKIRKEIKNFTKFANQQERK